MTDYAKSVNFAVKDTLTSGDPNKIVSGAEIDTEFNNLASSSTTKIDKVPAAVTNNVASFTATGAIKDSGQPESALIPSGGIIMWSGLISAIPTGWALCDGTNTTPDLRDRFIVGAGSTYSRNDTGGANSVTLTENQIPSHNHSMNSAGDHSHSTSISDPGHSHGYRVFQGERQDGGNNVRANDQTGRIGSTLSSTTGISVSINNSGSHTHTINNTGGDSSHENRPPYFALAFIMKL